MGNMTEGDSPQGSGTVRAMITAQERAERITEAETGLPSRVYAANRRSDLQAGRFGPHAAFRVR